mgnify:FL=1
MASAKHPKVGYMTSITSKNEQVKLVDEMKAEMGYQKLTCQKLSDLTGVSKSMISQVLIGKRNPSIETLMRMCVGLGFWPSDVIDRELPIESAIKYIIDGKKLKDAKRLTGVPVSLLKKFYNDTDFMEHAIFVDED